MQTFTYTKLINGKTGIEDLPRIDFISTAALNAEVERQILDKVAGAVHEFDVIFIADQAETSRRRRHVAQYATCWPNSPVNYPGKIFWADSRARMELFREVILKPNRQEAEAACHRALGRVDFQGAA